MNRVRLFKNAKIISRIYSPRNYAFSSNKQIFHCHLYPSKKINFPLYCNVSLSSAKCISNYSSMQTKDSDSPHEKKSEGGMEKILEDDEMRSILKDFANDFGVDSEANELLDDIRKNIDDDYEQNQSKGKHSINDNATPVLGGGLDHKYKEFSDVDAKVIRSYEENIPSEDDFFYHIDQELKPKSPYSDLKRGITGVFDIDEMVKVLHNESLLDITTISIPRELHYADFLVLATARSARHSEAVIESIKKIHKKKKNKKDPFVLVEGKNVAEWKVMDMGNIVLHVFLEETRALYDIESNWLFDSNFDSGGNLPTDPVLDDLEEQLAFFNSFQQSNSSEASKDIS